MMDFAYEIPQRCRCPYTKVSTHTLVQYTCFFRHGLIAGVLRLGKSIRVFYSDEAIPLAGSDTWMKAE